MSRHFLMILLGSLLFTSCTNKSNPSNELHLYTTLDEPIAQKLYSAFEAETGVHINFVRLSTGEAAARIETERNNPQASLWVGGVGLGHIQAKKKGLTEPYIPQGSEEIPAQFKDAENYWTGLYLGVLCLVANKNKAKELGISAPSSWEDLLQPKLKGQLQFANPGTSGTAYTIITTLISLYGEEKAFEFLKKVHANISQYPRSGTAPAKNAVLGETAVAVGYAHDNIRLINENKAPLDITFPKEGSGYEIASVSLLKGAKQPVLAKKLYDWLYTKKAVQILADFYVVPLLSKGIQLREHSVDPQKVKLVHTNIEWDGQNKDRLVEKWNDRINK